MARRKAELNQKCSPNEHNYEPTDVISGTAGGRVIRLYVCSKCGDSYWG